MPTRQYHQPPRQRCSERMRNSPPGPDVKPFPRRQVRPRVLDATEASRVGCHSPHYPGNRATQVALDLSHMRWRPCRTSVVGSQRGARGARGGNGAAGRQLRAEAGLWSELLLRLQYLGNRITATWHGEQDSGRQIATGDQQSVGQQDHSGISTRITADRMRGKVGWRFGTAGQAGCPRSMTAQHTGLDV